MEERVNKSAPSWLFIIILRKIAAVSNTPPLFIFYQNILFFSHCEMDRRGAICEKNVCLVDLELIERINVDGPSRNLHWRAANYSMFWGHTLKEGLQKRLGGLPPRKMVTTSFLYRLPFIEPTYFLKGIFFFFLRVLIRSQLLRVIIDSLKDLCSYSFGSTLPIVWNRHSDF